MCLDYICLMCAIQHVFDMCYATTTECMQCNECMMCVEHVFDVCYTTYTVMMCAIVGLHKYDAFSYYQFSTISKHFIKRTN